MSDRKGKGRCIVKGWWSLKWLSCELTRLLGIFVLKNTAAFMEWLSRRKVEEDGVGDGCVTAEGEFERESRGKGHGEVEGG